MKHRPSIFWTVLSVLITGSVSLPAQSNSTTLSAEDKLQAGEYLLLSNHPPYNMSRIATSPPAREVVLPPENGPRIPTLLFNDTVAGIIESRTGSYTTVYGPLIKNDESPVKLKSEWVSPYLFRGRSLPSVHLRILKNPATGEYHPAGGTLLMPGTGFEANYETELNSENYKATLQWKISF